MVATARVTYRKNINLPKRISGPTRVKVGFPAGQADQDNVNKAVWNEFGTAGGASGGGWGGPIPERPFMRNSARNNRSKYIAAMKADAPLILRGTTALGTTLSKLGNLAVFDIQAEITSLRSPPNSPVTIALKGSSNPLIDSGEMRQSVSFKVDK